MFNYSIKSPIKILIGLLLFYFNEYFSIMAVKKLESAVVFGSSNNQGNTYNIAHSIADKLKIKLYNLAVYNISNFDYTHQNKSDDFFPLITELIENYGTIIFVTPV